MKTLSRFLAAPLLILILHTSLYAAKKELHRFLEFSGRVYATGLDAKTSEKFMDSAVFIIRNEMTLEQDTVLANDNGEYYFRLPLDQEYMITVSRQGFASKKVHADTHIPLFAKGKHSLEFELTLWKEIPGMNYSLLDEPIAEVRYDAKHNCFDYDHAYTEQVNRELKKMYVTWYTKHTIVVKAIKKPGVKTVAVKSRKSKKIRLH